MEMSLSVALRYIHELLKAGDRKAAMAELERMIPQAIAWEAEQSAAQSSGQEKP